MSHTAEAQSLLPDSITPSSYSDGVDVGTVYVQPAKAGETQGITRTLGVFRFAMLGFFTVCGGPFGVEVAVGAAGPYLTFLSFFVLPLIWAIPQAAMTAELSTMIPGNGGYIVWVQTAFGDFGGFLTAINGLFSSMVDLAIYPTIFASYLEDMAPDLTTTQVYFIKLGVVALGLSVNVYGLKSVGTLSMLFTLTIFVPFVAQLIWKWNEITAGGDAWKQVPPSDEINWSLFLSTMLWSYTDWDMLGCVAGEVRNPGRTYPLGILLAILLVSAMYLIPLFVAIQTHPDYTQYEDGYFGTVAYDFANFMGIWVSTAALFSNVGLFMVSLGNSSRALWGMALGIDDYDEEDEDLLGKLSKEDRIAKTEVFRIIPPWVGYIWSRRGTPVVALVIHVLVVVGLLFFDFEVLVETDILFIAFNLLIEFSSFLWLRHKQPNRPRPFKIPGGWYGAWGITIPKLAVVCFTISMADRFTWIVCGGTNLSLICVYFAVRYYRDHVTRTSPPDSVDVSYTD